MQTFREDPPASTSQFFPSELKIVSSACPSPRTHSSPARSLNVFGIYLPSHLGPPV
jgi:hypothetical protein